MFGAGPEEEVVEEEVPTSATPDIGEATFFNSTPQSPAVPVNQGSPAPQFQSSSSTSSYSYSADEDTSAYKYVAQYQKQICFIFISLLALLRRFCPNNYQ